MMDDMSVDNWKWKCLACLNHNGRDAVDLQRAACISIFSLFLVLCKIHFRFVRSVLLCTVSVAPHFLVLGEGPMPMACRSRLHLCNAGAYEEKRERREKKKEKKNTQHTVVETSNS